MMSGEERMFLRFLLARSFPALFPVEIFRIQIDIDKTFWVMCQGLIQTLLIRLPISYYMSIQPNASLTRIGLAAPVSTAVGICLNIGFFLWLNRESAKTVGQQIH